jgi:DNA repair protein RAD5
LTTYHALEHPATCKLLTDKVWGRIVLDEMQEIRSSTTKIAKMCEQLQGNKRWMLSGTPLFEGIDDLRGELSFLRISPFGANTEDGFFNFAITKPWQEHDTRAIDMLQVLSLVMLRRSKSMTIKKTGMPILGLKPLTVEFVAVPQSVPERALYYFLESIVARELRSNDDLGGGAKERKSRTACLRLLREMCISAVSDPLMLVFLITFR